MNQHLKQILGNSLFHFKFKIHASVIISYIKNVCYDDSGGSRIFPGGGRQLPKWVC